MQKKAFKVRTDKVKGELFAPGLIAKILFDKDTANTDNLTLGIATFDSGKSCGMHMHDVEEGVFILSGRGEAIVAGEKFVLEPNVSLYVPSNCEHNLINTTSNRPMILLFTYPSSKPKTFKK